MKPIPIGYEARISVVVTEAMVPDFRDAGPLHNVYATYWLAKHMEEAGRRMILPFLEPGEAGIGRAVSVDHLAPTLPGMRVDVVAAHTGTHGTTIHARCLAWNELGHLIGEGTTQQVFVPAEVLQRRFDRLSREWLDANGRTSADRA